MSVFIEGRHVANVFTGQFLHRPLDESQIERFRKQAARYGFNENDYIDALHEVPVFSPDQHTAMLTFLSELAQSLARTGLTNLKALRYNRILEDNEIGIRSCDWVCGPGSRRIGQRSSRSFQH
ncbi:MAG: PocR ligand-binding domain-containing protein [Deltaproteobacteria bacterium]|nr:PocR ligand-binding domain-containing protein [Deltaproteobacteria bacterium]